MARTTLAALEADLDGGAEAVVVPAGSCATMVRFFWPELFEVVGDHDAAARARRVGERTRELTEPSPERADDLPALAPPAGRRRPARELPHAARAADRRPAGALALRRRVRGRGLGRVRPVLRVRGRPVKLPETSVAAPTRSCGPSRPARGRRPRGLRHAGLMHLQARAEATGGPCTSATWPRSSPRPCPRSTGDGRRAPAARHHPAPADRGGGGRRAPAHERGPAVDRFGPTGAAGLGELDDADGLRRAARAVKQQVLADLPALLDRFADQVVARGGNVWRAPTAADARRHVVDIVPPRAPPARGQVQVDGDRGDRPQPALEAEGPRWSRPTSASGSSSSRARRPATSSPLPPQGPPPDQGPVRRHRGRPRHARHRAGRAGRLRPPAAVRGVPRRRGRHHRRQPGRGGDGVDRARHERGQRPPRHRAAPHPRGRPGHGASRRRLAPGRPAAGAAGPFRHRPAPVVVHQRRHRPGVAATSSTGPTSCTS